MLLQQGKHSLRYLVWDKAHTDLEFRMTGHNRFDTLSVVSAAETMNFEGRGCPDPSHDFCRVLYSKRSKPVGFLETSYFKAGLKKILDLIGSRVDHIVIEAGDLHLAGPGVNTSVRHLHQLGQRVTSCSSRHT